MTDLELRLLACVREYRRLGNKGCVNMRESARCHREADALSELLPESDDVTQRYDDPGRVAHRKFVDSLFTKKGRFEHD